MAETEALETQDRLYQSLRKDKLILQTQTQQAELKITELTRANIESKDKIESLEQLISQMKSDENTAVSHISPFLFCFLFFFSMTQNHIFLLFFSLVKEVAASRKIIRTECPAASEAGGCSRERSGGGFAHRDRQPQGGAFCVKEGEPNSQPDQEQW